MNDVYKNIKSLRKEKGVSQGDMANALDMFQANYGKLERGITELTISRIYKIAEILKVGIEDILGIPKASSSKSYLEIEHFKKENEDLRSHNELLKNSLEKYKEFISFIKNSDNLFIIHFISETLQTNIKELLDEIEIHKSEYAKFLEGRLDVDISKNEAKKYFENHYQELSVQILAQIEETIEAFAKKDEDKIRKITFVFQQLIYFDEFVKPEYSNGQISILREEFSKYISLKIKPLND